MALQVPNVDLEHAAALSLPAVDVRVAAETVALRATVIARLQLCLSSTVCRSMCGSEVCGVCKSWVLNELECFRYIISIFV